MLDIQDGYSIVLPLNGGKQGTVTLTMTVIFSTTYGMLFCKTTRVLLQQPVTFRRYLQLYQLKIEIVLSNSVLHF